LSDEGKLHEQRIRGTAAQRELSVTGEAFEAVKKQYVDAWMQSDVRDTAGREKLWVATTILTLVEKQLRQYVADGRFAEEELKRLKKAGEKPTALERLRANSWI
jgi:hypothetical protein